MDDNIFTRNTDVLQQGWVWVHLIRPSIVLKKGRSWTAHLRYIQISNFFTGIAIMKESQDAKANTHEQLWANHVTNQEWSARARA